MGDRAGNGAPTPLTSGGQPHGEDELSVVGDSHIEELLIDLDSASAPANSFAKIDDLDAPQVPEDVTEGQVVSEHGVTPSPPEPGSPEQRLGELLAGRYRLERLIAKGGMGRVYLATQVPLERRVAVKLLAAQTFDREFRQRFFLEASTCARLVHRHIVTVHDYGESESGELFMAMEFLDGEPLSKVIGREVRLTSERTCQIGLQICRALRTAHKTGVVHRDLKPGNIMLLRDEDHDQSDFVKVLDFGLVKAFQHKDNPEPDLTRSGTWLGSPRYMAPEQIRCKDVDPRTDIYSLGVIMYHMVAGRPPFVGANSVEILEQHLRDRVPSIGEIVGDVSYSPELEIVIARCMEKDPEDRYGSMDELISDLKASFRLITGVSMHTESALPTLAGLTDSLELSRRADEPSRLISSVSPPPIPLAPSNTALQPAAATSAPLAGPLHGGKAPHAGPRRVEGAAVRGAALRPGVDPSDSGPSGAFAAGGRRRGAWALLLLFGVAVAAFGVTRLVRDGSTPELPTKITTAPDRVEVEVSLTSTPPGAFVESEGKVIGRTPLVQRVAGPTGSSRTYTIRHEGHRATTVMAELHGQPITLHAPLQKLERAAEPAVSAPPPKATERSRPSPAADRGRTRPEPRDAPRREVATRRPEPEPEPAPRGSAIVDDDDRRLQPLEERRSLAVDDHDGDFLVEPTVPVVE